MAAGLMGAGGGGTVIPGFRWGFATGASGCVPGGGEEVGGGGGGRGDEA